jgi:hypothetical protein
VRAAEAERQQRMQQIQALTQIQQRAQAFETEFRIGAPDYDQAVQHLMTRRLEELAAIGYAPEQRMQILQNEALSVAVQAMQAGRNPAEAVYSLAKMRGYQPPQAQNGNGQGAPAAPAAPDPAQRLAQIAAGQQQSRSLANVRGTGPAPITAQRLAEMSAAEFEQFLSKATPEQMQEAFGA